jgi:DNA processing protein
VRSGFTIISGLAYGIDAVAHRTALEEGGRTVAVLGSGLNRIYPQAHARLARRIARQGAVLSELPLDAPPDASNFPDRNRIVSGMSLGTLVVESREQGGALITARMACEQNREVFAVPGNAGRAESVGTNRLIQRGHAKLVLDETDILAELEGWAPASLTSSEVGPGRPASMQSNRQNDTAPDPPLEGTARTLYDELSDEPVHLDVLCAATGLAPSTALAVLFELELQGWVRQRAGKRFCRG